MTKPVSTVVTKYASSVVGSMVLAAVGTAAGTCPASALTLVDALASAYTANPQLEAQRAYVRSVDEQVPLAMSGWRPTVTVNGTGGYQSLNNKSASAIGVPYVLKTDTTTGQVTVTETVYNGMITPNSVKAADHTVQAARAGLSSIEQQVLLQAATAYINLLRDKAVVELNVNNQHVLERELESTQDQFRVGQLTRTDVSQAQASLAGAVAGVEAAKGTYETDVAAFQKAIGVAPSGLTDPGDASGLPASLDEAVQLSLANQPDIQTASYTADAAQDAVHVAEGALLPNVSVQASYADENHLTTSQSLYRVGVVEGIVSMPLYEGGSTWSKIRAAKHTAGENRIQVEQARQAARAAAVQAWQGLVSARAQVTSYKSQVDASTVALEGVRREQQVGSRTVLDVLTAEQTLLTAQVSLASALHDEHLASYQVLASVGRLTASNLNLNVKLYNPENHYNDVRGKFFGSSASADKDYEAAAQ